MKILLLRFSSIGDIVLTSPVIRCLKQQLDAELHFLTKAQYAQVLTANPYLTRIHTVDKRLAQVLPELRKEKFDWIIDLHHNLRSARVKWTLRRPSRSFNKLNFEKWLLVQLGINLLPKIHIVDRYMQTVQHLGVRYDGKGLDYFIPGLEEVSPGDLDPRLKPDRYIAFNIGANHATKRLPVEKIAAVCQNEELPVVLLGGKDEQIAGAQIVALSGGLVFNFCGKLSLQQSASVVRQAYKVVTHDSGLMHIAAAFRKEIVSIWGNTVPDFGMYPFYPEGQKQNTSMEVPGLKCRPCSKIGYTSCPKGHFRCMQDQDVDEICQALK
ncbi:MAG: glycosyltransferase family 9 protein [Lewinellaceae bacterium]|nr:glycosyltransferase family 9 protein [Saprospiraceae bacterium]MCB9330444.1 glycosyltransferase family 9 protein [Lewinellaceae bacterium]